MHLPPGATRPRRFLPRFHWELLVCGTRGHELLATDVKQLRPEDAIVAREASGLRWHRCLRCDSWIPLEPPKGSAASRETLAPRDEIEVPLRGRPLRDKIVLRAIAIDRAFHFFVLGLLGVAVLLFTQHRGQLRNGFYRVVTDIQGGVGGGPVTTQHHVGILHDLDKLFSLHRGTLHWLAVGLLVYAALEGAEAVGLWYQKRWAEYLTFIATTALLPLEIFELTKRLSWFKVFALIVNIAIVIYLISAKRLFGVRGGAAALEAEAERDVGWPALERTAPRFVEGSSA